ncbi:MAG: alpha/beta hydrolase [Planctomycetales bacterium]|nr:alpha/beta hydrolase [Planctomycetales bacterium]
MTLHPQAKAFIEQLTLQQRPSWQELGVHEAREVFLTFEPMLGEAPELTRVEDHVLANRIPARLYSDQTDHSPVVMFFHGGGWVLGNLETHDALCRRLAVNSGCTVVAVDYGRSPENTFPGPIDDCFAATKYVAENADSLKVDASRIAVAGDSAGGHLAAAVAIKARDESVPEIALQVLMYPVIEPNFDTVSYRDFASGFGLTRDNMIWFWEQFLGGADACKEAIPSRALSHTGLPPAIVITAQYDVLRDEGNQYARQLQNAGVDVTHREQQGMLHAFLHFADLFDTGVEVGRELAVEIGQRLKSGRPRS